MVALSKQLRQSLVGDVTVSCCINFDESIYAMTSTDGGVTNAKWLCQGSNKATPLEHGLFVLF